MLVIRRRGGESFVIGSDIEVEVLEIEGSQVKLGIRAPREVPILRSEVARTREANRAAAESRAERLLEVLRARQGWPPV
jgi:carbon storage regulator